ncbi:MAG: hypothetical protein KA368_24235 [Acidobacteria bacterium]|nr:hypothetical protein [Acidobacteriota bacterium]
MKDKIQVELRGGPLNGQLARFDNAIDTVRIEDIGHIFESEENPTIYHEQWRGYGYQPSGVANENGTPIFDCVKID